MRKLLKIILWILGPLAAIALVLYLTVFDVWTIPTDDAQLAVAIEPTLTSGDLLLVSRSAGPEVGSVVRCADPQAPGRYVIGRIVGNGNDDVEFRANLMFINGKLPSAPTACGNTTFANPANGENIDLTCMNEEFAGTTHSMFTSNRSADRDVTVKVEAQKVFLASDNRYLHLDSRDFGQIPLASCQRIILRFWGTGGLGDAKRRFSYIF